MPQLTFISAVQKFYLALFLTVVVLLAVFYFLPFSLILQIGDAAAELADADLDLSSADQRVLAAKAEEAVLRSHEADLTAIGLYYFSATDQLRIVEVIESLGRRVGVVVESDVLSAEKNTVSLRLNASGSYPAVAEFVRLIESAPLYFDIQSYWLERATAITPQNLFKEEGAAGSSAVVRATLGVKLHSVE